MREVIMNEEIEVLKEAFFNCASMEDKKIYGLQLIEIGKKQKNHALLANIYEEYCKGDIDFTDDDKYLNFQNAGIYNAFQGKFIKASEYFYQSLSMVNPIDDTEKYMNALINISNVEASLGNVSQALEKSLLALTLAEDNNNLNAVSRLYHNIGGFYSRLNEFEKALDFTRKSLKTFKDHSNLRSLGMTYNNLSNNYNKIGDNALSVAYLKRAVKCFEQLQDPYLLSMGYRNMASLNKKKNLIDEAYLFYHKSLEICLQINLEPGIMQNSQEIAIIHFQRDEFDEARKYFDQALKYSTHVEEQELLIRLFKDFASFSYKTQDYQNSADYYKKLIDLNNEFYEKNIAREIANFETTMEAKQKQKEAILLKQKNDELIFSYQEMEFQKRELEKLNKSKDTILSIVSHDLTNVLSGIKTATKYLLKEKDMEVIRNYIESINETSDKALILVKDILEASKIDMIDFKLNLSCYNLNDIVGFYQESIEQMLQEKNIKLSVRTSENPLPVEINMDKFWQIILNLISNAVKFSFENSTISIETLQNDSQAQLKISDQGIGIPEESQLVIFDKFTKFSRRGTKGESSNGLGLSIVKRLVELHNAQISVYSETGKGSVFEISLPLREKQ